MSTDKSKDKGKVEQKHVKGNDTKASFGFFFSDDIDDPTLRVINAIKSVDLTSVEAEDNIHSISDNNGGRIELNEDEKNIIKR